MKILLLIIALCGCKQTQWQNVPVPPLCPANVGLMVPADLILTNDVYPCAACQYASGCFTAGNVYCCRTWMCDECEPPPSIMRRRMPADLGRSP